MYKRFSKLKIGILNLHSHENYLLDLCKILPDTTQLTVFTTGEIYNRIRDHECYLPSQCEWVRQQENESDNEFLSRVQIQTSRDLDILISFPFYQSGLSYLQYNDFEPKCHFFLFVYNLNSWLGKDIEFTWRVDRYLKYPVKRNFLKKVDVLLVEFETIRRYAERYLDRPILKTFTPVLYDEVSKRHADYPEQYIGESRSTVITIPGMIDKTRRNYETVLTALNQLSSSQLKEVELILLGPPVSEYGARVIEKARQLSDTGMTITDFESWVSRKKFTQHVVRSDLLVSPLRQTRHCTGFTEYYGRSKGSGAISDAIRNGTPLLLPEWYEIPSQLTTGITTFGGSCDLSQILSTYIDSEEVQQNLKRGAKSVASKYTKDKQQYQLQKIIAESI